MFAKDLIAVKELLMGGLQQKEYYVMNLAQLCVKTIDYPSACDTNDYYNAACGHYLFSEHLLAKSDVPVLEIIIDCLEELGPDWIKNNIDLNQAPFDFTRVVSFGVLYEDLDDSTSDVSEDSRRSHQSTDTEDEEHELEDVFEDAVQYQ